MFPSSCAYVKFRRSSVSNCPYLPRLSQSIFLISYLKQAKLNVIISLLYDVKTLQLHRHGQVQQMDKERLLTYLLNAQQPLKSFAIL